MPRKPISFELDFMIKDIFPRFTVKQFDDVSFNIKPKNQGLDYNTTGMIGKIFVGVNNDMFMQTTGITVSNNNINILLDKNMLQKSGRAYAEVELTDNAGTITSSSFIFDIDPKIGEGGMIPGEYEGFVEKYERLISEFKSQVNSCVNNANTLVNKTINNCNTNVDNKLNTVDGLINTKVLDFEKRFNSLTSKQQQDAEVIDARDGETSLKARLDRDIEKAKEIYINVEGSNISTDSSVGYLKDVEIKGNTIQDENNLADIRSVGDKLEGQELYKIPILATNGLDSNDSEYQEERITILSPVQLEKVGDVADRIIEKDGVWGVEKNVIVSVDENNTLINTKTNSEFIPLPHDQQVKLRTFANKTDISFGCEIEGIIKAQVPKSLGATVNTHTTQISNLNKELDRVKKLEESTVSTVETECDFTIVEATSNGYFEDVKLEGKTLVNLVNYSSMTSHGTATGNFNKSGDFIKATITASGTKVANFKTHTDINSKLVTLIINNKSTASSVRVGKKTLYAPIQTLSQGVNILTINTTDLTEGIYVGNTTSLDAGDVIEFSIMILEGDHTQNPPSYFEGLKSVGDDTDEIVVSSVNENLFDEDNVIFTTIGINYGVVEKIGVGRYRYIGSSDASKNWGISFKQVKLPPNSNFSISFKKDIKKSNSERLYIKSSSGNVIFDKIIGNREFNFTTDVGDTYIFNFYCGNGTVANIEFELYDVCIKNKHSNFEYTPPQQDKKRLLYYNNETQTWEKPILRQWDSIEKYADGKYYYHQRSGEVVLNGSENTWGVSQYGNNENTLAFTLVSKGVKEANVICDKFSYLFSWDDIEHVHSNINAINITILRNKLSTQDVEGFKQWLQANNVTVVYQLAEEKVYECTNIDLITYANETNYIVESGAISPKSTLKVHNNISNVVSILQKKVSLLESNMTKYMITQNRLMLASRYNADSVSFKVDVATLRNSFEYDNDLYELILNNILVGKDNYDREYIENLIIFYWMDFVISDEMHSILFEIIEEQHNPKIVEDQEEAPLI